MSDKTISRSMTEKEIEAEVRIILNSLTTKLDKSRFLYDIVVELSKQLNLSEGELASCGLALLLTHGPGNMRLDGRIELHRKIDKEVFGIEVTE
jgi:hypothetical protein